ncbi:MAG: hypothetical protein LBH70_01155 [Spirochaetaceae bacterium]|jgi:hypothetical protein|nr:hypothetical protein [Spirochaetaceae bacterium]
MSEKRYLATLTTEEETLLRDITNRGKHGRRAQALLCAYEGCTDAMTAERTGKQRRSEGALRQRFVEEGFETTLEGKPRGPCGGRQDAAYRPGLWTGDGGQGLLDAAVKSGCLGDSLSTPIRRGYPRRLSSGH